MHRKVNNYHGGKRPLLADSRRSERLSVLGCCLLSNYRVLLRALSQLFCGAGIMRSATRPASFTLAGPDLRNKAPMRGKIHFLIDEIRARRFLFNGLLDQNVSIERRVLAGWKESNFVPIFPSHRLSWLRLRCIMWHCQVPTTRK